jgi:hypothetical protein
MTHFLFIFHCPIARIGTMLISVERRVSIGMTYILLLFPVPKSIMICLFLWMTPMSRPLAGLRDGRVKENTPLTDRRT